MLSKFCWATNPGQGEGGSMVGSGGKRKKKSENGWIFIRPVYAKSKYITYKLIRLGKGKMVESSSYCGPLSDFGSGFLINQQSHWIAENTIDISTVSSLYFLNGKKIGVFAYFPLPY